MATMIVTYNNITGLRTGRVQQGSAIAYSADWDADGFMLLVLGARAFGNVNLEHNTIQLAMDSAESAMNHTKQALAQDLKQVDAVYVYAGVSALTSAAAFIAELKSMGKNVHMIACDCDRATKQEFAQRLQLPEIIWSECGGDDTCRSLFDKFSA